MPPPSQLKIATSSLSRLIKEEASYHKELEQQETRLKKLEESTDDEDGNREFQLKQERRALEETRSIFPSLKERITDAIVKVESLMDAREVEIAPAEVESAREAVGKGKNVVVGE